MKVIAILTAIIAIAGCNNTSSLSTDLSGQPHTVDQYMADSKLAAGTIEACRGKNTADARVQQEKVACKNVREAESRRLTAELAAASEKQDAAMQEIMDKRRAEREKRNNN